MQLRRTLANVGMLVACLGLFACSPAPSQRQAAACDASFGLCVAREVEASGNADANTLIQAFIVTGAVSDIVRWNRDVWIKHRGIKLEATGDFRKLTSDGVLAAVTLAAASFNSTDPYSDAEWLAVGGALKDDHEVSLRAALTIRELGYDPWESVIRHPPGLEAIWRKVLATAPDDFDTLLELSGALTWNGDRTFISLARQFIDRGIALPNLTPEQRYQAARRLAGDFYDAEAAQAQMDSGGYDAKDREISDEDDLLAAAARKHAAEQGDAFSVTVVEIADIAEVDAFIAADRLWNGKYSEVGAQRFAAKLMSSDGYGSSPALETLRRGGAIRELRDIANTWLRRAQAAHGNASDAVKLYAGASDAFRMAGDKKNAIAAARAGMPLIPTALDNRPDIPDIAERRKLAGADNGMSIAPAVSLFFAGAEDEAIASGFTSGLELLQFWDRPLAEYDPQWVVDAYSPLLDVIVSNVIDRQDAIFAGRIHDTLVTTPGESEPIQLAILAAAAGNAQQVQAHLDASIAVAKSDPPGRHPSDKWFIMLRTVMAWKVSEMLLAGGTVH